MVDDGRVAALEQEVHALAVQAAAARDELARARAHEAAPAPTYPRLGRMLLAYQAPTLCLAVVLLAVPILLVLLPAVAVVLGIAAAVGYAGERRLARRPEPPSWPRTLARHQLCAGLLLQAMIVGVSYFLAGFQLYRGFGAVRWEDFLIMVGLSEAAYLLCVVLPLWLIVARRAHRAHLRAWPGPLT